MTGKQAGVTCYSRLLLCSEAHPADGQVQAQGGQDANEGIRQSEAQTAHKSGRALGDTAGATVYRRKAGRKVCSKAQSEVLVLGCSVCTPSPLVEVQLAESSTVTHPTGFVMLKPPCIVSGRLARGTSSWTASQLCCSRLSYLHVVMQCALGRWAHLHAELWADRVPQGPQRRLWQEHRRN